MFDPHRLDLTAVLCIGRMNNLKEKDWTNVIHALQNCPGLEDICDFEWSSTLLAPNKWDETPKDIDRSVQATRKLGKHVLDLHSKGLGDGLSIAVLAKLLPRVSAELHELDIRYQNLNFFVP